MEVLVVNDLFARLFCDCFKVIDHLSNSWKTNFNALNVSSSTLFDHMLKLNISWVNTSISKSMEYSCWNSIWVPVFCLFNLIFSIEWRFMVFFVESILEQSFHEWALVILVTLQPIKESMMLLLILLLLFLGFNDLRESPI